MIGIINFSPDFSNGIINHNNDTHLGKKTLINQKTGTVIKLKNTNADFRVILKERSLYKEAIEHKKLATLAGIEYHDEQNRRFNSLGRALTVIRGLAENGKAKEKSVDISDEIKNCEVFPEQGMEFISHFLSGATSLDSTVYALGLEVGSNNKFKILDTFVDNHLKAMWNLRITVEASEQCPPKTPEDKKLMDKLSTSSSVIQKIRGFERLRAENN